MQEHQVINKSRDIWDFTVQSVQVDIYLYLEKFRPIFLKWLSCPGLNRIIVKLLYFLITLSEK